MQKLKARCAVYRLRGRIRYGPAYLAARRSPAVSRQAIAAALAREDLTGGERLVAFSPGASMPSP
jgi:hypothetical protein